MDGVEIPISIFWTHSDSTVEICALCSDPIYNKTHTLNMKAEGEYTPLIIICDACYSGVDKAIISPFTIDIVPKPKK